MIFREIAAPQAQAGLPIGKLATWHTWSESFRLFLRQSAAELCRLTAPRLRRVKGLGEYNRTYSWSTDCWSDNDLRQRFTWFARSLDTTWPGRKIMLFDGLTGPDLNSKGLHALFALLRGTMVELAGDERAAMYTPLGEVGKRAGGFPLHADLYIPSMLFNVYDEVATDDSGASTFLPISILRGLCADVRSLPARQAEAIIALFEQNSRADGFAILYDLLHGSHPWVHELEQAMEKRQLRIKLYTGQGYLLDDRNWLHGRTPPRGGVPINRVHRLVFGGLNEN